MSDAPEEIWICPTHSGAGPDDYYVADPDYLRGKETHYLRADIAEARVAELEAVLEAISSSSSVYAKSIARAALGALKGHSSSTVASGVLSTDEGPEGVV